ncbi:MAG: hypothetical protein GYA20_08105 [Chloroflexi bacterium]|nr:hypothetical protein [Chloroflexota bacterium]
MEVLGIGLPELAFILVIIFLVLGPKDMASTARRVARTIRSLTQSEFWRATREAWRMAQDIPNELLRESGLEEAQKELQQMSNQLNQWSREMDTTLKAPDSNRIQPPVQETAPQATEAAPQADADETADPQSKPIDADSVQPTTAHE